MSVLQNLKKIRKLEKLEEEIEAIKKQISEEASKESKLKQKSSEAKLKAARRWNDANKEKMCKYSKDCSKRHDNVYQKNYYLRNKQQVRDYQRAYRAKRKALLAASAEELNKLDSAEKELLETFEDSSVSTDSS